MHIHTLALFAVLAACGSAEPDEDTNADSDSGDTADTAEDTDTQPVWPSHLCPDGIAVLVHGDTHQGGWSDTDVSRWTGQGDAPTDLYAVAATQGQTLVISVTYDDTQLPFTQSQYPFIHFLDDENCGLNFGTGNVGGTATSATYSSRFIVPRDGTWMPLVGFPEALPYFDELLYTLEVTVE